MIECKLCGFEAVSQKTLAGHIVRGHKTPVKEYHDMFVGKHTCQCGSATRFISLVDGYQTLCKTCLKEDANLRRSVGVKRSIDVARSDEETWASRCLSYSTSMLKVWSDMSAESKAARVHNMNVNYGKNVICNNVIHSDDVEYVVKYNPVPFNEFFEV